jgi:hypothetical protein
LSTTIRPGRLAQDVARLVLVEELLELDVDRLGMADEDRHAHAGGGDLDLRVEDLLGLGDHLPLFLGRAVLHEDVDMRDHVEGDLLGELLRAFRPSRRCPWSGPTARPWPSLPAPDTDW